MSNVKSFRSIVVVGPQHADTLPKSVLVTLQEMGYTAHAVDEREMLGFSFRKDMERKGRIGFVTRLRARLHDLRIKHSDRYEAKVYDRLAALIEAHRPDLVITHSAWIPPEAIRRLKERTHATVVAWFPDHPGNIGRQYLFAAPYDFLFFKDRWLVERAQRIGRKAFYLPEACMPEWHKAVELTNEEKERYGCDITTAGNLYYYRAVIFEALMKKYRVKLWGDVPRWLRSPARELYQGRGVTELEKSKAFRAAKIVLNTFQGEVFGVNQRCFEIAGCGGFQLCEHRDEIKEFFEPGKEIETFRTMGELDEKVSYYLAHEDKRQAIADAGYARAHREHTFQKRLEAMLKIISQ